MNCGRRLNVENKEKTENQIPDMSQLEFDDVVRVLMGVSPEGEEITIYKDEEESD